MITALRGARAVVCALAVAASGSQGASAEPGALPTDADLAQLLPGQEDFPAGWIVGQQDNREKAAGFSKDGILSDYGKHATPKNCYPDVLVFFSAFGITEGGKPSEPDSGSYVFATVAQQADDPRSRGYTGILHYWVDNCSKYSVEAIPDWSAALTGAVNARTMPYVQADDSVAIRVEEKTSTGPDVGMTAVAARLRGVEVLVTGYPGADERLVDDLFRKTVERIGGWKP